MSSRDFNILYVDDEPQNLVSFKATFRREYRVHTATSAMEGIEIMRQKEIQLIITDQRMPEITGVEFLEKVLPEFPNSIRMILTGYADMEAIVNAINKGKVFRYITKPWDENDLKVAIENAKQLYYLQNSNRSLVEELKHKVEEQERTLRLFMKYVPEPVVEKALNTEESSIFEGEQRHIVVLFCDIRGFTSMSEELSPKEVVTFLNDYYSLMTETVKKYDGTVNQFVGDEVFAVFGAPVSVDRGEEKAVQCALEMLQKVQYLNAIYQTRLNREVKIGIGINAGEVVAGNLGSEDRIEYSVTGDTVNTGKRIESLTKESPNSVLISDSVYNKVHNMFEFLAYEPVEVAGKKEKIQVYEVTGRKN